MNHRTGTTLTAIRGQAAFTLAELLVVVVIIVLLLATAVPATRSLIREGNKSLAQNQLQSGLRAARDAALRGGPGQDSVAVFLYDVDSRQMLIVTCVLAASFEDEFNAADGALLVEREIFTPDPLTQPVTIPSGWSVRGFAPPGLLSNRIGIDNPWYAGGGENYDGVTDRAHWLFPEEAFFDLDGRTTATGSQGAKRQTFVVRFEGGTGRIRGGDTRDLLVFDPAATYSFRQQAPFEENDSLGAFDAGAYVEDLLVGPREGGARITDPVRIAADLQEFLVGEQATDTVLARPVTALAVYEESQLAGALRIRLDRGTGLIYQDVRDEEDASNKIPTFPNAGFSGSNQQNTLERLSNWITFGQAVLSSDLDNDEARAVRDVPALLFRVEPDSGRLGEVSQ
ncbi:MAG: hypothetical protein AAGG07_04060 [Planctomycetota bacterium]